MGLFDSDYGDEEEDTTGPDEPEVESVALLVAVGFGDTSTVVVAAGELLQEVMQDLDALTIDDLPISMPRTEHSTWGSGFYVWEGTITAESDEPSDYEFDGEWRRAKPAEAALVAEGRDPWPERTPSAFYL